MDKIQSQVTKGGGAQRKEDPKTIRKKKKNRLGRENELSHLQPIYLVQVLHTREAAQEKNESMCKLN